MKPNTLCVLAVLLSLAAIACGAADIWQCNFKNQESFQPGESSRHYRYDPAQKTLNIATLAPLDQPSRTPGGRLFQLDLTFQEEADYFYFRLVLPRPIKITPNLIQSGYLKILAKPENARVQLGRNLLFEGPNRTGGIGPLETRALPDGWLFFSENLYRYVSYVCEKGAGKNQRLDRDNAFVTTFLIMVRGKIKAGERLTLLVSDLRIGAEALEILPPPPQADATFYQTDSLRLGERRRYEVRNRTIRYPKSGNALPNSGFELGLRRWDVTVPNPCEKAVRIGIDANTPRSGKRALRIDLDAPAECTVYGGALPYDAQDDMVFDAFARATGDIQLNGAKVGPEWSRFTAGLRHHRDHKNHRYINFNVTGKGVLYLDDVTVRHRTAPAADYHAAPRIEAGFSLNGDREITNFFDAATPLTLTLHLTNGLPDTRSVKIRYQLKNYLGKAVASGESAQTLPAGQTTDVVLPLPPLPRGIFYAYAEIIDAKTTVDTEFAFATIKTLDSRNLPEKSYYGASQLHWLNRDRELTAANRIGMKTVNIYGPCYFSNSPDNWRELAARGELYPPNSPAEQTLALAQRHGMEPVFGIHGFPKRLTKGKRVTDADFDLTPEMLREWRDFIGATAAHFRGRVRYFEIWIELVHDDRSADLAVRLLKAAREGIDRDAPGTQLLGCGFDPGPSMATQFERVAQRGGLQYLDIATIHPYFIFDHTSPEQGKLAESLQKIRRLMTQYDRIKPLWITEVSYQNANSYFSDDFKGLENFGAEVLISEERMADYLARMSLIALGNHVERFLLFPTMHGGTTMYPGFYAVMTGNCLAPKAGLPAYATLADQFSDARSERQLRLPTPLQGYLFRRDRGDFIAAVWNPEDRDPLLTELHLENPQRFAWVDLMNNPYPIATGAAVRLDGGTPLFCVGGDAAAMVTMLENLQALVRCPGMQMQWNAATRQPELRIVNPDPQPGTLELTLTCDRNTTRQKITVAPESVKILPMPRPDAALEVKADWNHQTFFAKFRPRKLQEGAANPADPNHLIAILEEKNRELFRGTPAKNLPPKIYGGFDSRHFFLTVTVPDKVHHQPHCDDAIWQGDAIQLAFDPAGNAANDTAGYNSDDQEYTIALTRNGPLVVRHLGPTTGIFTGFTPEITRENGVTTYRCAIPWQELGLPGAPASFGFNVAVTENDGSERPNACRQMTDGLAGKNGKHPYRFIDLVPTR